MTLSLQLFGVLALSRDGVRLHRPRARKNYWLLALLALRSDRDTDRSFLAGTFWPEVEESQALFYLRRSLNELRQELGPDAARLTSPTARTLCLNTQGMEIDLMAFDAALKRGDLPSLETAVELYGGDLLEGCDEPWVLPEREARREAFVTALQRLADLQTETDAPLALAHLRRAALADPLNEAIQRKVMEMVMQQGDFASMQQLYRKFKTRLREEIQSEPAPETTALYHQIRERAQQATATRVMVKAPARPPPERLTARKKEPSVPLSNLPRLLTSFIGREKEKLEVKRLLERGPLVTLTGMGGSGKTRLSLEVAAEVLGDYPDGVWLVELASLSNPTLVLQTVATTLGIREEVGKPLLQTLFQSLKTQCLLLILDNCEHVVASCADLAGSLLRACPQVRVLASSREALGIAGEQLFRVPALSLPAPGTSSSWEQLQEYESVRLFVERAMLVRPDFTVTPSNSSALVAVCYRLDGLPLALELAAARVRGLGIEAIQRRLEDRFRLLRGGREPIPPRQQSLRALMDWSYELLSEAERLLLTRLTVFAGGCTLEAAERVCGTEEDVLDLMLSLVDKSMVLAVEREDVVRYRLMETVHAYASERLEASGEAVEVHARHRQWCVEFVETADSHLWGVHASVWLDRIEAEHDNLRLALGAANDGISFRIAGLVWWFWYLRGYWSEGQEYLTQLLGASETDVGRASERARVLQGAGVLANSLGECEMARSFLEANLEICRKIGDRKGMAQALGNLGSVASGQSDFGEALALYEESVTIYKEIGDRNGMATSLRHFGSIVLDQGDYQTASARYSESLELCRESGDRRGMSGSLNAMGLIAIRQGNYQTARAFYEQSLEIYRALEFRPGVAIALVNLGDVSYHLGDYLEAGKLFEESLEISREIGSRNHIGLALVNLGLVAKRQGNLEGALVHYKEGLKIYTEIGHRIGIAFTLEDIAALYVVQDKVTTAARLWGAAEALREILGTPIPPHEHKVYVNEVDAARILAGAEAFAAAWQEGRITNWEQMTDLVLTAE